MTMNELAQEIEEINNEKGFRIESTDEIPEKLCLIHSEISEALEEYRNEEFLVDEVYYSHEGAKPEGFGVELADAIIRILHLTAAFRIDIDKLVREKIEYNKTRPHMHGRRA